ncbi:ABC transporter ATP-binding protein [Desulfovibrio intestinalis]|uniref:Nickel transport system ATP-binding protein n=1 Tax=Desulfovibrio intestinalis TaxID=58621 RepID=A0A7W8C1F8_9BACT|nr:dipeptide/oligopeptide/nickel ABC transporter ATP-binding protein [Desulfovibrio intestinalis]MBB5142424.1 nickel transport system ATP-binding protein [Desulfovibrio intestinalis]
MSAVLTATDIQVSFLKESQKTIFSKERQQVLRGIDLEINEGECLGIIGESGSGKSTLGRVLAGLLQPDSGKVVIEGIDIYDRSFRKQAALRHNLAIVFQDYTSSANPRFRVSSIIGESLRVLEKTGERIDRKARVAELLEQVGLPTDFAGRYPHELSGGQLQRVCIARAIALRPRVILLDEAISSLDASTQIQVMDLLMDLRKRHGLSYLFITHDLTSITYLCDRVLFFHNGSVVERVDQMDRIGFIRNDYARRLLESVMGIGVTGGLPTQEQNSLQPARTRIGNLPLHMPQQIRAV